MFRVRTAREADAFALAPGLREADLREIRANLGESPAPVLARGVELSEPCYAVVREDDCPVALFGAVPDSASKNVGLVWLLGSDELVEHPFFFLRNSRRWIGRLHRRYETLWNYVDARNEVHARWLSWCGFTRLGTIENFGVEGRPFHEFRRVRGDAFRRREPTGEVFGKTPRNLRDEPHSVVAPQG